VGAAAAVLEIVSRRGTGDLVPDSRLARAVNLRVPGSASSVLRLLRLAAEDLPSVVRLVGVDVVRGDEELSPTELLMLAQISDPAQREMQRQQMLMQKRPPPYHLALSLHSPRFLCSLHLSSKALEPPLKSANLSPKPVHKTAAPQSERPLRRKPPHSRGVRRGQRFPPVASCRLEPSARGPHCGRRRLESRSRCPDSRLPSRYRGSRRPRWRWLSTARHALPLRRSVWRRW